MDYGKIREDGTIQAQGNPVSVTVANPTAAQRKSLATLRGELPLTYTEQPEYDHETQYLTEYWVEENGKAVQNWAIHDIEDIEIAETEE